MHIIRIALVGALLVGATACRSKSEPRASTKVEEVSDQARELARDAVDDLKVERDKLLDEWSKRLRELDAQIAELETRYLSDAAPRDQRLAALRRARADLEAAFERARVATRDQWEDTKRAVAAAMQRTEDAYQAALAGLEDHK